MKGSCLLSLFVAVLCNIVRQLIGANKKGPWQTTAVTWESVLRRLGIRLGDTPTTVVRDCVVTVDALVRRADAFSDRPAGSAATTIISGGRLRIITTVPYGPHWVALRRNLTSEAFHPVRGIAHAAPYRRRAVSALVADLTARSNSGSAVPVRECLYAALFALNVVTCFGDGVADGEQVEAMRIAQREFLRDLPSFKIFSTFRKVAKLLYWDRWTRLVRSRRRQEEMYLPLIRARQEQRRRTAGNNTTATSYVDTLLDLEVPTEGDPHQRRKLSDGEMVGLVSEYLGASTGTILTQLEWTLANLVLRPDVQSRLRGEVEAAGGGKACVYLRAVVMEALRRHPPVPSVQRHMSSDGLLVGDIPVVRGTLVNFSLEEIGRDGKIWRSPAEEFIPDRFMPGGEGAGVRLTIGSGKEATDKVKMMPFGAGRRICPGMGYAMVNIEYFLANLVTAFEWHPVEGEEVDLTAEHGFFTTMLNTLRARVVPRAPSSSSLQD